MRENYRAALTAGYEIDFWGKNRAALLAAQETAVATRFAKEVVVLSTVVSVGTAYLQVLVRRTASRIARQNLAAATRVLDLIKQRFNAGTASQLDVAQQESVVATVRAAIPLFDQTLRQNIAVLAVLIGRPPVEVKVKGGSLYCAAHSARDARACRRNCCSSAPTSAGRSQSGVGRGQCRRRRARRSFRASR